MPADDLSFAIRVRADTQQALDEMRKLNDRLGDTDGRGRAAARSLGGLGRSALEAADAHEALGERAQAAYDTTVESARAAARDHAEAVESWTDRARAALAQVRRDSDDAADETRAVTVGAFRSMEHAIAAFATTGKLSFSGFVDSVIADLARLAWAGVAHGGRSWAEGGGRGPAHLDSGRRAYAGKRRPDPPAARSGGPRPGPDRRSRDRPLALHNRRTLFGSRSARARGGRRAGRERTAFSGQWAG